MFRWLLSRHLVAPLFVCCSAVAEADNPALVLLQSRPDPQAVYRVSAHFDVGGDLMLPADDGQRKLQKVPMSVVADLRYQERALAGQPAEDPLPSAPSTMARYYELAKATIKIGKGGRNLSLPDQRRLIVASAQTESASLHCPSGPFTREELDLIDIPAGTHVLDRLMPGEAKKIGDTWQHDASILQVLLGLDLVSLCEVTSTLIGVERGYAKLRLAGTVHGRTDGAATEIDLKAGYLFDTRLGRITRMNLAFAEKREEGRIGPALDVVGKLSLEIDPLNGSERLGVEQMKALADVASPDNSLLLLEDAETGLRLVHDRQWYLTSQERERLVLRRLDAGEFVAQCNISIRPERQEGRQDTLAAFERDVRLSLGERLDALITSGEWTNAAGLRCFRVVVHGTVDGLAMEWRFYLASPPAGRSVVLAVSVEPQFSEQLGETDTALVESIALLPVAQGRSQGPAASAPNAARGTARQIRQAR